MLGGSEGRQRGLTGSGAEPVLSPPESVDRNMAVRKHGWWAQRDLD